MTITGKVFLFLTLVFAVLFVAFAQPVYEQRRTTQQALKTEKEKYHGSFVGDKREAGLLEKRLDAERKRKRLRDLVQIQEERRAAHEELARKMQLYKQTEISVQRDTLADAELRASTIKSALSLTDQELNARDAEIKEMDTAVQQDRAFSNDLAQQVADLKAKLETAKTETQKLLNDLTDKERELAEVMRKQPDDPDADIASLRR